MKSLSVILILTCFTFFSKSQNYSVNISSIGSWRLASIPQKQTSIFPESNLTNDRTIGFNRAKLCWYAIDRTVFYANSSIHAVILNDSILRRNHLMREVFQKEIYPNCEEPNGIKTSLMLLNLGYYPEEKGPYNFDMDSTSYSEGIDSTGRLKSPESRWGGIMRSLENNYLSNPNLHYIGFWLMNPFVYDSSSTGGQLLIQIGSISEDVLKDNRMSCESSLNSYNNSTTIWGLVPNEIFFPYIFNQSYSFDFGLDGMDNPSELNFNANYLLSIKNKFGLNSKAYSTSYSDPSNDNYLSYRDNIYDYRGSSILTRYKYFNNTENNTNGNLGYMATSMPDCEDINRNNIFDTIENYFQYKVEIKPEKLVVGQNYIADSIIANPENGDGTPVTWYKILIPFISNEREVFGNINDISESNFVRLILKNFSDSVILRTYSLSFVTSDLYDPSTSMSEELMIFPNPSDGNFTIRNNTFITNVTITDLLGRIVYNDFLRSPTYEIKVDITNFKNGMYLLNIQEPDRSSTRNIIIQK